MDNPTSSSPTVDKSHWAYQQGRAAGAAGNTTERGLMAFGLGCAAQAVDARNTRFWLAGFDDGVAAEIESRAEARARPSAYADDGMLRYGQRCSA